MDDICKEFPLIYKDNNTYQGLFKVNKYYKIRATLPNFPDVKNLCLQTDPELYSILQFQELNFDTYSSFFELLSDIVRIVKDSEESKSSVVWNQQRWHFLKQITNDFEVLGDFVHPIGDDFDQYRFELVDPGFRKHIADIKVPANYPNGVLKVISSSLPVGQGQEKHFECVKTLKQFRKKFQEVVELLQPFWATTELIDANCWVLEPHNPTLKDTYRRVKISEDVSIVFEINTFNPQQRPNINFLGPIAAVNIFRSKYEENLMADVWDSQADLLENMLAVLDLVTYPEKPEEKAEESWNLVQEGECAICYLEELEGQLPSVWCDTLCKTSYHQTCLYKQLRSMVSNKILFSHIQGECPNCQKIISCPVPKDS